MSWKKRLGVEGRNELLLSSDTPRVTVTPRYSYGLTRTSVRSTGEAYLFVSYLTKLLDDNHHHQHPSTPTRE